MAAGWATALLLLGAGGSGEGISPDQFETLRTMIRPDAGGMDDIPWMPTLWEARQKAAAEGKPLYVMSGGGPPLGAT
jgi:hypothetical protein